MSDSLLNTEGVNLLWTGGWDWGGVSPLSTDSVDLFWTGGWDSTFQLLQLLLNDRHRVAPFNLIDADRRSTGSELRTMKRIKDCIVTRFPHTRDLLEPTRYSAVGDIAPDSEITEAFQAILEKHHLGSQYERSPRACSTGWVCLRTCKNCDDLGENVNDMRGPILGQVAK